MRAWLALVVTVLLAIGGCCSALDERREDLEQLERLDTMVNDPEEYARRVEAECADDVAESCTSLGVHHAYGTYGRTQDPAAAIPYLEKGCRLGHAYGCHELGVMFMVGRGVDEDHARAMELFEGSCAEQVANSCHYLGDYHARGEHVPQDAAAASEYYEKACAAGSTWSCGR